MKRWLSDLRTGFWMYVGIFAFRRLFPFVMVKNDGDGDDASVEAIFFATNEKVLRMYSTRHELAEAMTTTAETTSPVKDGAQ